MVRPSEWCTEVHLYYCIPIGVPIHFLLAWDGLALYLHNTQAQGQALLKRSSVQC